MSGLEIAIPVISAIFALVSAFKDGGTIVEKIKDRRRRNGAYPPDDRLQRAFSQGAEQIQQLREEGVHEFGATFERDAAASRLKDIAIVLQDSIIRQLAAAHHDDTINDFNPTITTVIQARMQAVNILNELYMALQLRTPATPVLIEEPPRPLPRVQTITSEQMAWELVGRSTITSIPETVPAATSGQDKRAPASPMQEKRPTATGTRRGSWFNMRRRPSSSDSTQRPPALSPGPSPGDQDLSRRGPDAGLTVSPRPDSARSSSFHSPQMNRASTNSSIISPPPTSWQCTPITKANEYASFCKGAWHAQQLQLSESMKLSNKTLGWMYHCRKCKFRLTADGSRTGDPHFDERIQESGSGAVHFRQLFLWKSHIETKDDKARLYRCILCALSGGKSGVYKEEDHLFEHISRHGGAVFFDTQIIGPIEVSSDGIMPATVGTFDFYIPQQQHGPGSAFMLPESAIPADRNQPMPLLLLEDPYENAWRNERSHATELG